MKVECPRCHTHVEKPLHGDPVCPTCGFGAPEGGPAGTGTSSEPSGMSPPAGAAGLGASSSPGPGAPGGPSPGPSGGTSPAAAAPAAGWERMPGQPQGQKQGLAITALVLGILGCCTFVPIFSIAGLIFGIIALKKVKEEPQTYGGHGMAMAGLILGIVGTIVGIIAVIFYAAILAAVFECEENPNSEFCQQLEEEGESPMLASHAAPAVGLTAPPTAMLAPMLLAPRAAWRSHAG